MSELPLVLDLFSGTGSATQPFVECGKHRVVRIDINPEFRPDIVADIRHVPLDPNLKPEFIWASPPCDDFTDVPWNSELRMPSRGYALWMAAAEIIRKANCLYVIENVRGAQKHVGKADCHRGSRYLWTSLALIGPVEDCFGKWRLPPSEDRKMLRSMIPRPLAESVHNAVCEFYSCRRKDR